jgi:hypothetical protein
MCVGLRSVDEWDSFGVLRMRPLVWYPTSLYDILVWKPWVGILGLGSLIWYLWYGRFGYGIFDMVPLV